MPADVCASPGNGVTRGSRTPTGVVSKSSFTHGSGERFPQQVASGSRMSASSAIGFAVVSVNGVAALTSSRRASSLPARTRSRSQSRLSSEVNFATSSATVSLTGSTAAVEVSSGAISVVQTPASAP